MTIFGRREPQQTASDLVSRVTDAVLLDPLPPTPRPTGLLKVEQMTSALRTRALCQTCRWASCSASSSR